VSGFGFVRGRGTACGLVVRFPANPENDYHYTGNNSK
jgi:hypothetical protein